MTLFDRIKAIDPATASFCAPLFDDSEFEVLEGDQHLGALDLEHPLIVFGNLRVDRAIVAWEHAHLIVIGQVEARGVGCMGALYVHGDLRASELVYLCSGNDYSACIAGTLDTPLVIEQGMHTCVRAVTGRVITTHNRFMIGDQRVPHTDESPDLAHEDIMDALASASALPRL